LATQRRAAEPLLDRIGAQGNLQGARRWGMTTTAKLEAPPAAAERSLYDRDFYSWAMQQADLLRERRLDELDVENVAEEIESSGRSEAKELRSSFRILLTHLLKWQYEPRRRSKSWRDTIGRERDNVPLILKDNPGLRPRCSDLFAEAYRLARKDAMRESALRLDTFPAECPYSVDQALDEAFLPD
jgi:Domain of unknown function DUF29